MNKMVANFVEVSNFYLIYTRRMWPSSYRSSMIKYATQRLDERLYSTPLGLQYLNFSLTMKASKGISIIEILFLITSPQFASNIFESYIACCLYTDGLDFLLNMTTIEDLHAIDDIEEFFAIQEVSLHSLYVAEQMCEASFETDVDAKINKYKRIEEICGSTEEYDKMQSIAKIIESVRCIRKHLTRAFEFMSYKLQHPIYVFTGIDASDEDDVDFTNSIFTSTTTTYNVAKKFASAGSMGMGAGGQILRIKIQPKTPLLPLTSTLFNLNSVKRHCVSTSSPLEENEILILTANIAETDVETCSLLVKCE